MALRRPLPCESAGIAGRRRTPAVQPRRPPRLPGPQTENCPQMMTTGPTSSTAGDIPRGRVRSTPAGDSPRVRGQVSRPRRRRTSPPATTCPRPHKIVPARAAHPPTPRAPHPAGTNTRGRSQSAFRPTTTGPAHGPATGPQPQPSDVRTPRRPPRRARSC